MIGDGTLISEGLEQLPGARATSDPREALALVHHFQPELVVIFGGGAPAIEGLTWQDGAPGLALAVKLLSAATEVILVSGRVSSEDYQRLRTLDLLAYLPTSSAARVGELVEDWLLGAAGSIH